jgi:PhnB protein
MQPISPYLTINSAEKALEFYQKAFGATDIFRHADEDGKRLFHARMTINGGTVLMSDDYSKDHGGPSAPTPEKPAPVAVSIALESADKVDAMFAQAVAAGGNGVVPPEDMFWGDRFAIVIDPFGHRWMLNAPLKK